jgi:serine/threonine protein kinase/tetratricopeptide (TPR) repeat protein
MNPTKWKAIKETFSAVLELPLPERRAFLSKETEEVRREVERLLAVFPEAKNFINEPLVVEKGLRQNRREENLVGKRIDDYVILEKLGEGGMGVVFLAEQRGENFTQKVALKLIKRGMDTNLVLKRFLMERQILASLEHPNIARLFDGGSTDDGLPFFVMEYVEGESIKKFCENHGFDTRERLELFRKVCQAISHAHQKLVIHRDIKPSNILVSEAGEPKLLDFGIAKLLSPDWNAHGTEPTITDFRLMTPEYASPEQMRGQLTTTATDVYSLGVVLYELLTGTRPFKFNGKNAFEISADIDTQIPLRPSDAAEMTRANAGETRGRRKRNPKSKIQNPKSLKGDLDNIILKAIRREPERRYHSVHEFGDDIHRYLSGLPVKATADSGLYRLGKFINRHRAGVLACASFVLLLVAATALTSWQYFVARSERAKAQERFEELHAVAKSLLTDTNEALRNMPDGLEIRKSIVEKSVAVLDKLAIEEKEDAVFLTELADAYEELGKIRYLKFHESRAALGDYGKALRLREKAIRIAPQDVEIILKRSATLGAVLEVHTNSGDLEKILELWQMQRDNNLQALALEPENPRTLYGLSAQTEEVSGILQSLGRGAESEEQWRQSFDFIEKAIAAQAAKPFSPKDQVDLVTYMMQKGSLLQKAKRPDEALAIYQTAAGIAEKTYRADPSLRFAFNHASRIHRYMADIYGARGDWQKYLENTEFSVRWLTENVENKALNLKYLRGSVTFYIIRTGIALDKLGQKKAGMKRVDEGVNLYVLTAKENAKDGENLLYAPETLEMVSQFYGETNQTEKCARLWQEFIDLIEPFVVKNPNDTTSLGYLAYALERRGDVLAKYQSDRRTFAETDKMRILKALTSYQQSNTHQKEMLQFEPTNQTRLNQERAVALKISELRTKLN